jgi:serine/threonine protein kinase
MISANGYLKLVDFGFAKQVPYFNKNGQIQYRSFTCCGTPDYMAP